MSNGYQEVLSLLTPERLDGMNYIEWSLNARNKLRGRKRWGFISGTKAAPVDTSSTEYEVWEEDNCMIKSWLLDAMTKDIRSLFLRLSTAKEIWDTAKLTYSVSQDASKAYQLHCEVLSIRQNGGTVIQYFGKLCKLWQEYDAIDDCIMECPTDIKQYTSKVDLTAYVEKHEFCFDAVLDEQVSNDEVHRVTVEPIIPAIFQRTKATCFAWSDRSPKAIRGGIPIYFLRYCSVSSFGFYSVVDLAISKRGGFSEGSGGIEVHCYCLMVGAGLGLLEMVQVVRTKSSFAET
ncbi:hypothetical protein IFM89_019250 [Coptis chinensis]|uniref:Retrotransposon Copia-like N-terminal domain-containing protein n=1 Tax=Coptis chinensis TaxID=261450 RepID=A0A835HN64_9MAGN|nr:hypothetical protein IFM89_019250 [Coptis chinensis]